MYKQMSDMEKQHKAQLADMERQYKSRIEGLEKQVEELTSQVWAV
jgi:polyhydroxyalkanoate synthesis regulator phasin